MGDILPKELTEKDGENKQPKKKLHRRNYSEGEIFKPGFDIKKFENPNERKKEDIKKPPTHIRNLSRMSSDENLLCAQCLEKEPDAVFMNCGHGGVCYHCSLDVWQSTEECYLCRSKIQSVQQFDMATRGDAAQKVITATHVEYEYEDDKNKQ